MPAIGLLGGTFNPVHLAHLRAAEEVREALGLDRVELIPSAVPPHKTGPEVASAEHRRRMLALAIADDPHLVVNTTELERGGRSYSIDTIRLCQKREPEARFTFILGADAFIEIESWKEFAEIFSSCDVCVMSRPGFTAENPPIAVESAFCYDPSRGVYTHRSGHLLLFLPVTPLMIAASDIRARHAAGRSIRYLVPPAVYAYIVAHGLYRGGTADR